MQIRFSRNAVICIGFADTGPFYDENLGRVLMSTFCLRSENVPIFDYYRHLERRSQFVEFQGSK